MKDYYERKRKAVEATVNEIHKARAAYEKQTSEKRVFRRKRK